MKQFLQQKREILWVKTHNIGVTSTIKCDFDYLILGARIGTGVLVTGAVNVVNVANTKFIDEAFSTDPESVRSTLMSSTHFNKNVVRQNDTVLNAAYTECLVIAIYNEDKNPSMDLNKK